MEFRVLGPLEVSAAGRLVPLGGPKQRAILAVLLLRANEVVPREQLIDEVWGDEPPAEVDASLRVYVARLRKILAVANGTTATLETHGNGYVLRVSPDALDLVQFETLLASGSAALAAGEAAEASADLSKALGLWRGPALADLGEAEWAQRERHRLEARRLRAVEERIEADLAAGRHADVVAELQSLVASDPGREGLVRQLMLALYRSGRQRDALQAYGDVRRVLTDDFGLEPTRALRELERRILLQDPALDPPPPGMAAAPRARAGRRRRLLTVGAGLLVVAGAAMLVATVRGSSESAPVALAGDSVVVIDAKTNDVLGEVPIGGRPSGIAIGFGSVWAGNVDDNTLLRIEPRTRDVVETIGLGVEPRAIAVGGGSVWVLSRAANAVLEVDPVTNTVVDSIDLPTSNALAGAFQIEYGRGAVWATSHPPPPGELVRIDANTHAATIHRRDVSSIASTGATLWGVVGWSADRIRRIEPPGETIRLDRLGSIAGLGGVVADDRAVWTGGAEVSGATLWRIDPAISRVTASVALRHPIGGVDLGARAVWIVTRDGYVLRVDPQSRRVVRTIALGLYPPNQQQTIAAAESTVWVATLAR